jgi:hypothetical protein
MKELIVAVVFCAVGMTLCFSYILYKNDWTILRNGSYRQGL